MYLLDVNNSRYMMNISLLYTKNQFWIRFLLFQCYGLYSDSIMYNMLISNISTYLESSSSISYYMIHKGYNIIVCDITLKNMSKANSQ